MPLDETYFVWLYSQVGDPEIRNPSRTYWRLLRQFYIKEFVWLVPHDDNRIADGEDLRYEFVDQAGLEDVDPDWLHQGCSMLEMLIGLSRRLNFITEIEPRDWFWQLIENLGLRRHTDARQWPEQEVEDVLDRVIFRTYSHNGEGSLFPLRRNNGYDLQQMQIWDQMNAYLLENAG